MVEKSGTGGCNKDGKIKSFDKEYRTLRQMIDSLENSNKNPTELLIVARRLLE